MKFFSRLFRRMTQAGGEAPTVDYRRLEQVLQYSIKDQILFSQALSHRSYLQVVGQDAALSNERLEFLGDAVLSLAVAEYFFHRDATAPEGDLTKIRSRFVNRKALTAYANEIHLGDFMLMSIKSDQVGGKGMGTILADGFEAIVGAIYVDGGYGEAKRFVSRHLETAIKRGIVKEEDENFKSQLLEYAQAEGWGTPRYVTINEEGPDHDRTFTVEVYVGRDPRGVGMGKNKKDAEQAAAEKALQQMSARVNGSV